MTYSTYYSPKQTPKFKEPISAPPFFAPPCPFRYTLALSLRYKWDFIVTISLKRNLGSRWER